MTVGNWEWLFSGFLWCEFWLAFFIFFVVEIVGVCVFVGDFQGENGY